MSIFHSAPASSITAADVAAAIVAPFARMVRFIRHEAEIARAERHMGNLHDHILRDIGVHRSEIHVAVRMGRDEFGRRYL